MSCQQFLHLCQPGFSMVRKGWTQVEVPNGWVQLNRGPRPKSGSVSGRERPNGGKPPPHQRQSPHQRQCFQGPIEAASTCQCTQMNGWLKARVRVGQLESALKALDPSDPAAVLLQEALREGAISGPRMPPIRIPDQGCGRVFEQEEETSFRGRGSPCGSHCEARSFPSRSHRGRRRV